MHGAEPRRKAYGSVTMPVVHTATFAFDDTAEITRYFNGESVPLVVAVPVTVVDAKTLAALAK